MRKKLWTCTAFLICLLLSGCQETPKEDVIVPKQDVKELLEENTELPVGDITLREYLEAPETVDLSLTAFGNQVFTAEGVTVTVPETSGLPSAQLSRHSFDEAYLEKVSKYFFKESDIYKNEDPVLTKSDYQSTIETEQKTLDDLKADGAGEGIIAEEEAYIEELRTSMASAPDTWEPKDEPAEYVFNSNNDFRVKSTVDGTQAWLNVYVAKTYSSVSYFLDDPDALYGDFPGESDYLKVQEGTTNRCRYTKEEAVALCEAIFNELVENELIPDDNFVVEGVYDQYDEVAGWGVDMYTITDLYGYNVYYTRQINNVKETRTNTPMWASAEGEGEGFIPFHYEELRFKITDKGIISFSWDNCMKMKETETAYNNVSVLSFPQIKTAIETNLPLLYADLGTEEDKFTLTITEIRLGLMCLRNKNDNNSFTMVPVWDVFCGESYYKNTPVFCLNAIDGSVIDRQMRY